VPNPPFAFALFVSSYSPALLILAVRAFDRSWTLFWLSLGLATVAAASFYLFIRVARRGGPFRASVVDIEARDAELAAYVATYLLPFVVVFGATPQDVVALALFLIFIGLLWLDSGLIYLNPLLALARYRVYVVQLEPLGAGSAARLPRSILLSRQRNLRIGDQVEADRITSGALIDLSRNT
jgi:hypothetical protein